MPRSLFVSHGSPMLALEPGPFAARFAAVGAAMPEVRTAVVMSPHWRAPVPAVGAAQRLEGIHDHFGFPEALYRLRWDAPGAPGVAREVGQRLRAAGFDAPVLAAEGVDHGVWVPLALLFPDRPVAVVPVAQPARLDARGAFGLGRALAGFGDDSVLPMGSGSLTHNLRDFRGQPRDVPPADYASAFSEWFRRTLEAGDLEALLDWKARAPHALRAHPTDEHLLPLFFALGAGGEGAGARRVVDGFTHGVLAMDAWRFDATEAVDTASVDTGAVQSVS